MSCFSRALAVIAVAACACTGSGGDPDAGNIPNVCDDGGSPTVINGQCNSISFGSSAVITRQQVAQALPTPAGGPRTSGTYYLTSMSEYTGTGGASGSTSYRRREVLQVNGAQLHLARFDPEQCIEERSSGTVSSSGWSIP